MAEDFVSIAGQTVIYPGTGFAYSASSPVTFNLMGEVKPTKTQIPVYAGKTNIVGPVNPATPTTLYTTSLGTMLAAYNDAVNTFSTDGAMTTIGTYLSDGSGLLDSSFQPLTPSSTDSVALNRGVVISVSTDNVWTVNSPLAP